MKISQSGFQWRYLLLVGLYILSSSISPIIIELLVLNGAAEPSTMLVLLPTFVGMGLSVLTNPKAMNTGTLNVWVVIALTILDLALARLTNQGMIDAGSTIYTVVHCSGTVFTALFAVLFLRRHLTFAQWIGIVVITLGLCVITIGMHHEGHEVLDGIVFILLGAMIHSFFYVVAEHTLVFSDDPVAPEFLCAALGITGGAVNLFWQCFYTFPRFNELVVDRVNQQHGSVRVIVMGYIALTVAACVSTTCLYNLLHQAGSATTGVIKGLQAVLTFVTSHFAFCATQQTQCFTPAKGCSLAIVVVGVLIYSYFAPAEPRNTSADAEEHYRVTTADAGLMHGDGSGETLASYEMTPIVERDIRQPEMSNVAPAPRPRRPFQSVLAYRDYSYGALEMRDDVWVGKSGRRTGAGGVVKGSGSWSSDGEEVV